jgi:hypothetical protein
MGDQLLIASEVRMTIWLMLIIIAVLLVGLCLVLWFGPKEWDSHEMWRP